jgi:uncharacterized membrane protein
MPRLQRRYAREGTSLGYERVAFFTDAVFAIALTLIVVGIGVPAIEHAGDAGDLWSALHGQFAEFASFFVGVLLIGRYWTANHATFEQLGAVDPPYARWNVIYVGFVAFLPYPIRLIGTYFSNPLSLALLALNLAAVSSMEALLFAHAWRADLLIDKPSTAGYRWILLMSLLPVPVFLLSIPVAFATSTGVALACWLVAPALQTVAIRHRPVDVADF